MKRYFIVNEYFGSRVYDSKNKTEEYYNSEDTEKIRNKLHGNFIEIDHKRTNQLSSPLKISMNITKKCNLRCKQCFTESGICLENELNTKEIYSLFDQMREFGTFFICLGSFNRGGIKYKNTMPLNDEILIRPNPKVLNKPSPNIGNIL